MTVWIGETDAAEIEHQDSGQAAIIEIGGPDEDGPFVRLHSWRAETREHPLLDSLAGKRVRVTVELVPDDEPGTLGEWLFWRFGRDGRSWASLVPEDQEYWEHEAAAVRRAVERGGFKDRQNG